MTLRRTFVGLLALCALSAFAWCRCGTPQAHAHPAEAAFAHGGATEEEEAGGNRDDQAYRYRTNQARHWRHVMIGGR